MVALGLLHWRSEDPARYLGYLLIAVLASTLKVKLPGVTGTMSVSFLFILIGILKLSFSETLVMGCVAALMQLCWQARMRVQAVHLVFNVASMANAIGGSFLVYRSCRMGLPHGSFPMMLMLVACAYFLMNTMPVAVVIALTEGKPVNKTWKECYFWSLPFYLVGASIVGMIVQPIRYSDWDASDHLRHLACTWDGWRRRRSM